MGKEVITHLQELEMALKNLPKVVNINLKQNEEDLENRRIANMNRLRK